jgi:hypothetical protein
MEYLMTYGWAILVIMVVGVAMWQLGIFSLGGASPATSTGFESLKPLLATCQVSNRTYWGTYISGFSCQFVNTGGAPVRLGYINATVNGKYCPWMQVSQRFDSWGLDFEHYCENDPNCPSQRYYLVNNFGNSATILATCNSAYNPSCSLEMPADSTLIVSVISANAPIFGGNTWGPCNNVKNGEMYDIFVDIGYSVDIGGGTSRKHSSGTIRMTGSTR